MDGAEAPDEFGAVDADDFVLGQAGLKDVEGLAVVFLIAVGGDEERAVDEVEVDVGGGEAFSVIFDGGRHGDFDDFEGAAVLVAEGVELFADAFERFVIGVFGVLFGGEDDLGGGDEAGEVVDVAIGVVAFDAAGEPADVGLAVVVFEVLLDAGAVEVGVAVFVEEAVGGGEKGSGAVHVDSAAFHDDARVEDGEIEFFGDTGGDGVVLAVGRVFAAPGVEAPVDDGGFALFVEDDRGAVVAAPIFIRLDEVEANVLERAAMFGELLFDEVFVVFVGNVDVDGFARGDFAEDAGEVFGDSVVFGGEGDTFGTRPGEPGAGVSGPFGGEGVPEGGGGSGEDLEFGGFGHGEGSVFSQHTRGVYSRGMKTLQITVNDGVAETIESEAAARGKSAENYLAEEYLPAAFPESKGYRQMKWAEIDRRLQEVFAQDTTKLPATDCTYSREDIYFDHD